MLSYAATGHLRVTVAPSAGRGINRISKAAYHQHQHHYQSSFKAYMRGGSGGRGGRGGNNWVSRALQYLRSGLVFLAGGKAPASKTAATAAGHLFSRVSAGRLAAHAPRMAQRASVRIGSHAKIGTIVRQLVQQMRTASGTPRMAGKMSSYLHSAFRSGGRWSPYLRIFTQTMRSLSSGPKNVASARVIMAQLQRQAIVAGSLSQQRRDFATVPSLAYGTRIGLVRATKKPASAAAKLATETAASNGAAEATGNASAAASPPSAEEVLQGEGEQLHPVAQAIQAAAVPMEQCVTITIPYTIALTSENSPTGQQLADSPLANVAQMIADVERAQQRHTLLLSRFTERLAATGWNIQHRHVSTPTPGLQLGLPPSSGIRTAAELESLMCDWGFDVSLFAATIRDPIAPSPPMKNAVATSSPARTPGAVDNVSDASTGRTISTIDSNDIDSRLFSLIVDQVVDPEEAYRDEVRDFLAHIERMPRLTRRRIQNRARFGFVVPTSSARETNAVPMYL
ncbi:hypothetical protein GGI07_001598 [Coemansia sp. Benny D115]|nr:hypothetical protein GGI07_001598 [Coemansia sp. Benny D115]